MIDDRRVYLANSKIPGAGLGLFAAKPLPVGTVFVYWGKILNRPESVKHFTDKTMSEYVYSCHDGKIIDAREARGCPARYINDGPHSGVKPNADWFEDWHPSYPCVILIEEVKKDEEILIDYGKFYWSTDDDDNKQ